MTRRRKPPLSLIGWAVVDYQCTWFIGLYHAYADAQFYKPRGRKIVRVKLTEIRATPPKRTKKKAKRS